MSIPILDLSSPDRQGLAAQLRACCCEHGFFYLVGHGVSQELMERLERLSQEIEHLTEKIDDELRRTEKWNASQRLAV